jgi:hypothetical protein
VFRSERLLDTCLGIQRLAATISPAQIAWVGPYRRMPIQQVGREVESDLRLLDQQMKRRLSVGLLLMAHAARTRNTLLVGRGAVSGPVMDC